MIEYWVASIATLRNIALEESPIHRILTNRGFTLSNHKPSLGEFAGSKSTMSLLIRKFHRSEIRLTSRTQGPNQLPDQLSRWRGFQMTPSNPVHFVLSRSPCIPLVSHHLSPPNSFSDLLFLGRSCRLRRI
ncbi:hypothetical protein TNCV_2871281 [Trichonephila clavipes]|nr:hypothetical protein TNCV_2871281 [Trichonephila clavipes]